MPELELIRGPLSTEHLRAVAALYGVTDDKYGDSAYCEHLFNHNPFGPALHAFAVENSQFVGHYCLIPYDLVLDGTRIKAAKGEALHVSDTHRRSECDGVPTSSALLQGAQRLAEEQKLEISFAIVGAPGVIRLFQRCGYEHRPFTVRDWVVPATKALPLAQILRTKVAAAAAAIKSREALLQVDFQRVRQHLPMVLKTPVGAWSPFLEIEALEWFGKAPGNLFFALGEAVGWLTQTHSDWEVLCTFTSSSSAAEKLRFATELRKEATARGIDRIRVPLLQSVEPDMVEAFATIARRQIDREISFVARGTPKLEKPAPLPFLWSHF